MSRSLTHHACCWDSKEERVLHLWYALGGAISVGDVLVVLGSPENLSALSDGTSMKETGTICGASPRILVH
jgi:hypothetical protein